MQVTQHSRHTTSVLQVDVVTLRFVEFLFGLLLSAQFCRDGMANGKTDGQQNLVTNYIMSTFKFDVAWKGKGNWRGI